MILRSYARAFATNRRIYRIDRWAVPIPGGLPLAASAWFLALAITLIGLAQLPGVNAMASVVGWPATILIGPAAGAVALTRTLEDGRSLPSHALCYATFQLGRVTTRRPQTGCARRLLLAPDHSLAARLRVIGPGRVAISHALGLSQRSATAIVAAPTDAIERVAQIVELAETQKLEVYA